MRQNIVLSSQKLAVTNMTLSTRRQSDDPSQVMLLPESGSTIVYRSPTQCDVQALEAATESQISRDHERFVQMCQAIDLHPYRRPFNRDSLFAQSGRLYDLARAGVMVTDGSLNTEKPSPGQEESPTPNPPSQDNHSPSDDSSTHPTYDESQSEPAYEQSQTLLSTQVQVITIRTIPVYILSTSAHFSQFPHSSFLQKA